MTYEETLRLLASWAGRYVVVSVRSGESPWYVATLTGLLPQRSSDEVEGAADLEGESWSYAFSNAGWRNGFTLRRDLFQDATLEEERSLVIAVDGLTLDIYAPKKWERG